MSFFKLQMNFINNSKTFYKKTKKLYKKNNLDVITLTISCPTILPSNGCNQNSFPHLPLQTHKFLHFKTPQTFRQQKSNTFFLCKLYTRNLLEIIIPLITKINKNSLFPQNIPMCFFPFPRQMQTTLK